MFRAAGGVWAAAAAAAADHRERVLRPEGGRGMPGDAIDCVTDPTDCKAMRMAKCTEFGRRGEGERQARFRAGQHRRLHQQDHERSTPRPRAITPKELADMDDVCKYVFQGNGEVNATDCDDQVRLRRQELICDKGFCATQDDKTRRAMRKPGRDLRRRASTCVLIRRHAPCARPRGAAATPATRPRRPASRPCAARGGDLHRTRRARPAAARPTTTA